MSISFNHVLNNKKILSYTKSSYIIYCAKLLHYSYYTYCLKEEAAYSDLKVSTTFCQEV